MSDDLLLKNLRQSIGTQAPGGVYNVAKQPIEEMRVVMFPKMMVHPQTKEMVMVPMQDFQYKRAGSQEWFSMPIMEAEKHEFNPELKPTNKDTGSV